ncbi:MAG TPA: glycerophosphodiester phosphodiesterase family protein [Planctomycetota bacterium]|nr:glycerophosphodiester phosphodiesterase family protein [Planctomycetota bacterium]
MLNIAHRGASGYAPENTRAAFDLAIQMKAPAIETDIQITADEQLVIFHDSHVNRTSDGQGPVADYTLEELRKLDIGKWKDAKFAGERILTFPELLDAYGKRVILALEIKDPRATSRMVRTLLDRDMKDGFSITSFYWGALLDAQAIAPHFEYGYLTNHFDPDMIERIARRGFRQICPPLDKLTPELVEAAHKRGLMVRAWWFKEKSHLERLLSSGADGVTCDWPDWIPQYVASRSGMK